MLRTIAFVAGMLALAACQGVGGEERASAELADAVAQFESAFRAGDARAVAALYSEDAIVLPPGAPRVTGRAEIARMWQGFMDAGVRDFDLETEELEVHRNSASELGTFTFTATDSEGRTGRVRGKYIALWKRDLNGAWRLHRDIWNNTPPPGQG